MASTLAAKIESGAAVIGVIGLGYVGLPLMHAFHAAGHRVIGFDIDPRKIESLKKGENYLKHLGPGMVKEMLSAGRFDATDDFTRLAERTEGFSGSDVTTTPTCSRFLPALVDAIS